MSADDKAAAAWDDYVSQQQEEKIEQLERELNAANDRIKRLEEESESRWMLAQSATGSCAEMSSHIKRLEEAGNEMSKWLDRNTPVTVRNDWLKAKEAKL